MRAKSLQSKNPVRVATHLLVTIALLCLGFSGCGRGSNLTIKKQSESPWRHARGSSESTGYIDATTFNGKLDVIWERKLSEKAQGPMSLSHNTLFYTGAKKRLFAIDPENGQTLTKFKSRGCPESGALVVDSLLYHSVAPPFNQLDCRSSKSNKLRWRSHILDISAPLSFYEDNLFAVGGDGILYCFNRFDGELNWEHNLQSKSLGGVALQEREGQSPICWVGASSGDVFGFDIETGDLLYKQSTGGPIVSSVTLGPDNVLYTSAVNGMAHALQVSSDSNDSSSLKTIGSFELASASWSAPALSDGFVVFSDNSGSLFCFANSSLQKPVWNVTLSGALFASPVIVGDYLIVGMLTGDLYCLELATGKLISSRKLDHAIRQSPVSDGSSIYVATQKRWIYRLGKRQPVDLEQYKDKF